jgi:hypothetical protein
MKLSTECVTHLGRAIRFANDKLLMNIHDYNITNQSSVTFRQDVEIFSNVDKTAASHVPT